MTHLHSAAGLDIALPYNTFFPWQGRTIHQSERHTLGEALEHLKDRAVPFSYLTGPDGRTVAYLDADLYPIFSGLAAAPGR